MTDVKINLHVRGPEVPEDGSLVCAHCKLPHPVTVEEQQRYERYARKHGVGPDQIWECGACYLAHLAHMTGGRRIPVRTACKHDVPPFAGGAK